MTKLEFSNRYKIGDTLKFNNYEYIITDVCYSCRKIWSGEVKFKLDRNNNIVKL